MNKNLVAGSAIAVLSFVAGAYQRPLMLIADNSSSCPQGYICLANAKVVGAENFRTQTRKIGFQKEETVIPVCDLILITSRNERFNIAEDYCRSTKDIKHVFGEKITLMIHNNSAISINWKPLAMDYPDMIFMGGMHMRPIQLNPK